MITTQVFNSGTEQAVLIPKKFHFDTDKVEISQHGLEVILKPVPKYNLEEAFYALTSLSDDFMENGRQQPALQIREDL